MKRAGPVTLRAKEHCVESLFADLGVEYASSLHPSADGGAPDPRMACDLLPLPAIDLLELIEGGVFDFFFAFAFFLGPFSFFGDKFSFSNIFCRFVEAALDRCGQLAFDGDGGSTRP